MGELLGMRGAPLRVQVGARKIATNMAPRADENNARPFQARAANAGNLAAFPRGLPGAPRLKARTSQHSVD